jgi:septal ring factor EnvC (AmiA/AmiB activator)
MHFKLLLILIFIGSGMSHIRAEDAFEKKISKNRNILEQLQNEINEIQSQISKSKIEEGNITGQITLIDKKVALISRSKGLLERERRLVNHQIDINNTQLEETQIHLKALKKLYAERAVYAYKYGRVRNLELILSSDSFNQALVRYQYLKLIAEHDERTIRSIEKKEKEIRDLKVQLEKDLTLKEKNLVDKKIEEKKYLTNKSQKTDMLKNLRWTQSTYQDQLRKKQAEQDRLASIIAELDRQRRQQEKTGTQPKSIVRFDFDDFTRAKGKLPWPVKGKIITRYGKQRDPGSKTYVNNTDIEIQSAQGTPVISVFTGVIRKILYMPGYGNTVVIDHGKGYYTTYSHLDEIYVHEEDFVKTSDIIATVGDSGSFSGSKLQFGIFGAQSTFNPESWLLK